MILFSDLLATSIFIETPEGLIIYIGEENFDRNIIGDELLLNFGAEFQQ